MFCQFQKLQPTIYFHLFYTTNFIYFKIHNPPNYFFLFLEISNTRIASRHLYRYPFTIVYDKVHKCIIIKHGYTSSESILTTLKRLSQHSNDRNNRFFTHWNIPMWHRYRILSERNDFIYCHVLKCNLCNIYNYLTKIYT